MSSICNTWAKHDMCGDKTPSQIQDEIIEFYFQCVRTDQDGINELADALHRLLAYLYDITEYCDCDGEEKRQECLTALFKLIAQTRDIKVGKGQYAIAYMMICIWHQYYPDMAYFALRQFVIAPDGKTTPLGSWKDIKYICECVSCFICIEDDPFEYSLVKYSIALLNEQFNLEPLFRHDRNPSF